MQVELSESEIELICLFLEQHAELGCLELKHKLDLRKHGYWIDPSDEVWYCEVHKRQATFMFQNPKADPLLNPPYHTCSPDLGGITMPCRCEKIDRPLITKDGIKP